MTNAKQRGRGRYQRASTGSGRVRRNRIRPNYLLFFCLFVTIATVVGSACYVLTTPSLNIKHVDLKGVRLANSSAIEKMASRAIGHNIILQRTSPIIKDVRKLSEIKQVKMGRRYPNRMWLRVWERKADAVLATSNGYYLVQADGFVFHKISAPPKGLLLVEVPDNAEYKPGTTVSSPSIKCALQALCIAKRQSIKIDKISIDHKGDICLNMGSDFCAKLGQPDSIALKMSLLRNALLHRPSIVQEGAYIDLSVPTDPAWRPKVATQTAS